MNKFILAVTGLLFAGIANAEVPQLVPVNISDPILEKYNIRAKAAAGKESAYRIPEGSFYYGYCHGAGRSYRRKDSELAQDLVFQSRNNPFFEP